MTKGFWIVCVNVKNHDEFKKYPEKIIHIAEVLD